MAAESLFVFNASNLDKGSADKKLAAYSPTALLQDFEVFGLLLQRGNAHKKTCSFEQVLMEFFLI